MIITVSLNPAVDRVVTLPALHLGDTNRIEDGPLDPGGKGINVTRMINTLGGDCLAMGFVAGPLGKVIEDALARAGIREDFVHTPGQTRQNLAIVETRMQRHTILSEAGPPTELTYLDKLRFELERRLRPNDWVVLAGSVPPGIPASVYADLTEIAHAYGAMVCLDADEKLLELGIEAIPDLVKPNCEELGRLVGRTLENVHDVLAAAYDLRARGIRDVVVSRGGKGAVAVSPEGAYEVLPPPIRSISAIGAGDSLVAGVVYALARGEPLVDGLRLGTAAGAATALQPGTRLGTSKDVERFLPLVVVKPLTLSRAA